jgi:hypothetical protein
MKPTFERRKRDPRSNAGWFKDRTAVKHEKVSPLPKRKSGMVSDVFLSTEEDYTST